ncbi:sugar phosphate nucleotidyltransferase [Paenibacillus sp. 453mf]|uniref:sugar phosphate nucleotidyltransferase n=1 Tax=Paenibacillus sp. 453mf TaxID=1761874 RepID=UPI0008F3AAFC|nr:sugar phosphate nucleotidyltransferase [Paenibacillus sp. 453mf]SFS38987.1 mannose-1-phosphate guanylyltransferase [Paenibacillus sp. 453mf]
MKLILLSGGSGKRLWPLSNDARSKQFLRILDSPGGSKESMVQRVWRQIKSAGLEDNAYIATSYSQVEIISNQLGNNINLVVEPERRDTFPAIALAATYLYSIEGISLDETIAVLPVDPFVQEDFFNVVKKLDDVLKISDADLALIGVKPTYPSEKYGYIIPDIKEKDYSFDHMSVKQFVEKPHKSKAEAMISQNAFWNCGVFAFKLDYLINILIDLELPIQYEAMLKQYNILPAISFDYKVVEKANNIVVTAYDGYWKDLGTWNTLTDEMSNYIEGRGYISEDSSNTHLINELNLPVTILGLSNIVVATSADGILVSDKEASPKIKDVLKGDNSRPMYEERRWGTYQVLDYTKNSQGEQVLTKRICIKSGNNLSYQYHNFRDEMWTIISGEGELVLDDHLQTLKQGDLVRIPSKVLHSVKAKTDLEIIEVQMGTNLIEEDIVRVKTDWADIVAHCL